MRMRTGRMLADAISYGHGFFVTVALLSLPAVLIWPELKPVVVTGVLLVVGGWLLFGHCAVSDWERSLRQRFDAGRLASEKYFIQRYFRRLGIRMSRRVAVPFGYAYAGLLVLVVVLR